MEGDFHAVLKMADVQLAVTPALRRFPFQIPQGAVQQYTAIPRARLTFQANDITIVAKIATNTTSILATCTLPENFVYTFEFASQRVVCPTDPADAGNFDDVSMLSFGFSDGLGSRSAELFSRGITGSSLNAGSQKVWSIINPYLAPIFNLVGAAPVLTFIANDTDAANTVEGDYSCLLSLLQYDMSQLFNFPLNYPVPVSNR